MQFQHKNLLGLQGLTKEEITGILDVAETMLPVVESKDKRLPLLQGKTVVTLFYENSTRTRTSFELAAKYLGATVSNIVASTSSVQKGESLKDTGKTLDQMGTDAIVIRHPMSGAAHKLAEYVNASVLNAGDGLNEHPTQALLDMLAMRTRFGRIEGLKVAIVGDVLHSRVARSNLWGLTTMGASVTFAGPTTLLPEAFQKYGAAVTNDVREAVTGADVVMALRIQRERQKAGLIPSVGEYARFFGINEEVLKLAKPGCVVMHPGPMNRNVEIDNATADAPHSLVERQVHCGVAVRMAVLSLLVGGNSK